VAINWGVWREVGIVAEAAAQAGEGRKAVSGPASKDVIHPLLERCIVDSGEEKIYTTELTDRHWVVDEHRFKSGEAVLPGTASLEMAIAAVQQNAPVKAVEIKNLSFLEPLILRAGERRELGVTLKKQRDFFDFIVSSKSASGQTWRHAAGTIEYVGPKQPRSRSIAEIEARCEVREHDPTDIGQNRYVDFGPRWKNITRVAFGAREALVAIELPKVFNTDLEHYKLHPATLDMATGGAHALISGQDGLKDFYVPLSYGKVRVNAPLPAKLFSHISIQDRKENQKGIAVFDISILDEDGVEIVEISDFVVRKVTDIARMAGQNGDGHLGLAGNGRRPEMESGKRRALSPGLLNGLEQGITPPEGVDAFLRILSRGVTPRIVVASQDLNALIDAANADGKAADAKPAPQAQPAVAQHARPELPTRYVAPSTDLERQIAEIWQGLLGIQQIGIHDDFFELGGHSLMIVTIHSKLQDALQVTFPVAKMFQYPTINALATYLREGQGAKPTYGNLRDRAERQRAWQKQLVKGKTGSGH
jgi:acyl carrier protein